MKDKGKTIRIIVMLVAIFAIGLIGSNVKAFSLTLTSIPERNAIQLNWNSPEGNLYKVWQLKPGDTQYQSISTMDVYTTNEPCRVLNLYPVNIPGSGWGIGQTVTFTTYDGETLTLLTSGSLKKWMEEPNSEDPKGYGRGLIEVTPVPIPDFNANPWVYLKDANGNYKVDVIYIGHWDGNGANGVSNAAASAIEQFINDGLGFLMRT